MTGWVSEGVGGAGFRLLGKSAQFEYCVSPRKGVEWFVVRGGAGWVVGRSAANSFMCNRKHA